MTPDVVTVLLWARFVLLTALVAVTGFLFWAEIGRG